MQAKVKNRVSSKLDIRYKYYSPEFEKYSGRALRLLKSLYSMNISGKLYANDLIELLLEAGFIQSQFQMSIYYKYTPYGSKNIFFSYVDDCVYWYINEDIGKWFVDTLEKKVPCELLGIWTLVHVNKNFLDEGSFHLCGSG